MAFAFNEIDFENWDFELPFSYLLIISKNNMLSKIAQTSNWQGKYTEQLHVIQ